MRLVWITDPHLDHLGQPFGPGAFGKYVLKDHPDVDAFLLTGDIGEFNTFAPMVKAFSDSVEKPVWFVLGNHDAYGGSISEAKKRAGDFLEGWLPKRRLVELAPGVALVGVDGWYDARNGNPKRSNVVLNDFIHIHEYLGRTHQGIIDVSRHLADREAALTQELLLEAIAKGYKHILFATHVPPYAFAAWHEEKLSDGNWLPWMSSRTIGEALDIVSEAHPDVQILALCGHTHSPGYYRRSPNLTVLTGSSDYGNPRVSRVFSISPEGFGRFDKESP